MVSLYFCFHNLSSELYNVNNKFIDYLLIDMQEKAKDMQKKSENVVDLCKKCIAERIFGVL